VPSLANRKVYGGLTWEPFGEGERRERLDSRKKTRQTVMGGKKGSVV